MKTIAFDLFTLLMVPLILAGTALLALAGDERVALVIGNGKYQHASALANPVNDATAVNQRLEAAGYRVIGLVNAEAREMLKGVRLFCDEARGAESALFFYAGHGVEVRGTNYLLGIEAKLDDEIDLKFEALSLDDVLKEIGQSGARIQVFVMDCCRDNPLPERSWLSTRGFGSLDEAAVKGKLAEGSILVYSAAPGKAALDGTGDNSPFTSAWLKEMQDPGKSILKVFGNVAKAVGGQEPWIVYNGKGAGLARLNEYPLLPGGAPAPPSSFSPGDLTRAEMAANTYVERPAPMPDPIPEMPPVIRDRSELFADSKYEDYYDSAQKAILKKAQQRLDSLSLYDGEIDGQPGITTHAGIFHYQIQKALNPTARLDDPTLASLGLAYESNTTVTRSPASKPKYPASRSQSSDDEDEPRGYASSEVSQGYQGTPAPGADPVSSQYARQSLPEPKKLRPTPQEKLKELHERMHPGKPNPFSPRPNRQVAPNQQMPAEQNSSPPTRPVSRSYNRTN